MAELFDILTYDFEKLPAPIPDLSDTYPLDKNTPNADQFVMHLETASLPAGDYVFGLSITVTPLSTNDAAGVRFSLAPDPTNEYGSPDWDEFTIEARFDNVAHPLEYTFPKSSAGGVLHIWIEAATPIGSFSLDFCDIWIERVG